jgi:hypothetical protein
MCPSHTVNCALSVAVTAAAAATVTAAACSVLLQAYPSHLQQSWFTEAAYRWAVELWYAYAIQVGALLLTGGGTGGGGGGEALAVGQMWQVLLVLAVFFVCEDPCSSSVQLLFHFLTCCSLAIKAGCCASDELLGCSKCRS